MLLGKKSRKVIATTLLVIFVTNTFAPSISYALTSGPTQPEATSFEPIDTTDMVNTLTGDFTYNIPLLEVPGPEGGYPLSLSYHGGIQPNMDASWVGLGWTLNPGAIDRNVNGYPDDWYEPLTTSHTYWQGGQVKTYNVGVSIGIANTPVNVSFGLSFAHDTYQGFGVGADLGVGVSYKIAGNFAVNANIGFGVSPFGDEYVYGGVGLGYGKKEGGLTASLGVQAQSNFKSLNVGFAGGIGFKGPTNSSGQSWNGSLLGASIGTGGNKPSLELGGLSSSVNNSNAGRVSTSSHSFSVDIPVYYFNLRLGYSKVRYWTNENTQVMTWGSLNNLGAAGSSGVGWDNAAYDEYSLLEDPSFKNIVDYPDPTTIQGGSYPDFDVYSVKAQGLGGNMRPYLFQGRLANQNIKNGSTPLVTYYLPGVTNSTPFFRFENDFSNRYTQTELPYPNPSVNLLGNAPPMDPAPLYGYHNGSTTDGTLGYGYGNNLAGSKHVDIGPKIHPRHPLGYVKTDKYIDNLIEGFSITNESGVTYHFGLPAYTSGEENYQEKIDQSLGATGNRITKPTQYAYTWYLTTITGPDFVDRNGNGIADDGDWGYWVDFEYGKWSNKYNWRNPSEGFNRDEDNQWQNCSMGTREVYYLNAIRTRSHLALFEKDIRNDGKGASPEIFNKTSAGSVANAGYANQGLYNSNSSQSLKLSHIYLLNASDESFVSATSGASYAFQPNVSRSISCPDCELASNVLDRSDVDAVGRTALEAKSIRVIDFNYDYSLCANTTNSFDINNPGIKTGKLTLLNLVTRGKGGASLVPGVSFGYDLTNPEQVSQTGVSLNLTNGIYSFSTNNGGFNIGDLIWSSTLNTFCGVITDKSPSSPYVYTLANCQYSGSSTTATVATTKNPPYNKDAYDSWGMYKSDYNITAIAANENLGRMTTPASAQGVDVWSLRSIVSPLGGQIKLLFEPDQIVTSVLKNPYPFIMTSPILDGGAFNKIAFKINTNGYALQSVLRQGDVGQLLIQCLYVDQNGISSSSPTTVFNYTVNTIDADGTIHTTLSSSIPSYIANTSFSQITTGNISGNLNLFYGGGSRVKSIEMFNDDGSIAYTNYDYTDPSTKLSSGTTSYLPSILDNYDKVNAIGSYNRFLYKNISSLYSIARELPPPCVMYKFVSVSRLIQNKDEVANSPRTIEGKIQYQFEVFNSNMVGITDITARTGPLSDGSDNVFTRNMALVKFTGALGNVKRVIQYDNTGQKLSETINNYLHDGLQNLSLSDFRLQYSARLAQYFYQGFLQERYYEDKYVQNQPNSADNGIKATLSAREEFPCIQTGQTVINYVNGTRASTTNLAFDFYSGAVTKTVETDAYGNNFMTETVPAYRAYPVNNPNITMGLKINNDNNKNMLTQVAETYRWKVDGSNTKLGLVSASVNTWTDQNPVSDVNGTMYTQNSLTNGDVWRMTSTYNWMPTNTTVTTNDGTTPLTSFTDFNWTSPTTPNGSWKNTSNINLYDVYSKALDASDINSNHSATRMNYGDLKVVLTGGPAKFSEIAYSGAEDAGVNQTAYPFVQKADASISTVTSNVHTGIQSLAIPAVGKKGFLYSVPINNLTPGSNYQASVWVKTGNANVALQYDVSGVVKSNSGLPITSQKTANGWTLLNLFIKSSDLTSGTLNVYCINNDASAIAYADDFRFQPINASTTAYVYDPFSGELTYTLDNNNVYSNYVYDAMGRLTQINKEKIGTGVFKTNDFAYNYSATKFGNDAISQVFTRTICPSGQVGNGITVNIPANTYFSFVSKLDANNIAMQYGQSQANSQGTCSVPLTNIILTNNVNLSGYRAIFNSSTTYSFPTSGSSNYTITPGTYQIGVAPTGGGLSHTFTLLTMVGGQSQTITGTSATFNNIILLNGDRLILTIN